MLTFVFKRLRTWLTCLGHCLDLGQCFLHLLLETTCVWLFWFLCLWLGGGGSCMGSFSWVKIFHLNLVLDEGM